MESGGMGITHIKFKPDPFTGMPFEHRSDLIVNELFVLKRASLGACVFVIFACGVAGYRSLSNPKINLQLSKVVKKSAC